MDLYEFDDHEVVPIKELTELYEAVGWIAYAVDPDGLARAVDRSTYVVTVRNEDGQLVGLARCLSDDVHVVYLQDVLVHPDHRRRRLGTVLVQRIIDRYADVRQKVLLTDDQPDLAAFYRSLGFEQPAARGLTSFVSIAG